MFYATCTNIQPIFDFGISKCYNRCMKIINLNYDGLMSNSYLVFINDKIYLVDPSIDVKTLKKYINKLDGILITHGHFDHISYLKEIYDFYKPKVYCHKNACIKIKDNVLNCSKMFTTPKL